MKQINKTNIMKYCVNVSDDMPKSIRRNFEELEKAENEMYNMFETVRIIAKQMYLSTQSSQTIKTKDKQVRFAVIQSKNVEFYESLHRISELYHPNSLLGYVLNLIAEQGYVLNEFEETQDKAIHESVLVPCQNIIRTYPFLNKFRFIISNKYATFQTLKEKVKSGEKFDTGTEDHPALALNNLGVKFEENQKQVLKTFASFINKEQQTIKRLVEMMEIQQKYHQNSLKVIEKSLETIHNRLNASYRSPIFGVTLEKHLNNSKTEISVIIHDAVAWLINNNAFKEEGLFRLPGNKIKVDLLAAAFDAGVNIPIDYIPNVHVMCGVLKKYLRSLPHSILFVNCKPDFIKQTFRLSSQIVEERLKVIVEALPREYYKNLRYLFKFLKQVSTHAKENLMTSANLGMVFGPSICSGVEFSDEEMAYLSTSIANVVTYLIEKYDIFFPEGCELSSDSYMRICSKDDRLTATVKHIGKTKETIDEDETIGCDSEENCYETPYYFTNSFAYKYHDIKTDET